MDAEDRADIDAEAGESACPHCGKPSTLCVCERVAPVENRVEVLILQHPQEQDRLLGTARLAGRQLARATFRIGLSWPSLAKALGREAQPADWAVLYLGAANAAELPANREVVVLDKKGAVIADQDAALRRIRGVVVFDGTWAQAKTLWWRNAWVLKARRLVLNPKQRSLYGALRREPRRESLSTIEAIGLALSAIEGRAEIGGALRAGFAAMLDKYRAAIAAGEVKPDAPKESPRRDWRGKRRRPGK
ncbi:MAG: DTW domain-containing protein [Hyphomicrobiales bacterium]|nr:DTW domain-containing protein [Hyphomicrobiales bacterium]